MHVGKGVNLFLSWFSRTRITLHTPYTAFTSCGALIGSNQLEQFHQLRSTEMKKTYVGVILLAAVVGSMTIARSSSKASRVEAEQAANGAFRDGAYLAKLAVQNGEPAHISVSRWSTGADRQAFVAGYTRSYGQNLAALAQNRATNAAFRDGLFVGRYDAKNSNDLHISVGRWSQAADRELFEAGYRKAYGDTRNARTSTGDSIDEAAIITK
jgi:hypothetical protein